MKAEERPNAVEWTGRDVPVEVSRDDSALVDEDGAPVTQAQAEDQTDLLTRAQVADILGIKRESVYTLYRLGRLPGTRYTGFKRTRGGGPTILWSRDVVDAYAARRQHTLQSKRRIPLTRQERDERAAARLHGMGLLTPAEMEHERRLRGRTEQP